LIDRKVLEVLRVLKVLTGAGTNSARGAERAGELVLIVLKELKLQ
jgi:hypothetical protein